MHISAGKVVIFCKFKEEAVINSIEMFIERRCRLCVTSVTVYFSFFQTFS